MAIIVTCPGCRKSFSVRDEFGGRTGPCPKCKTMITIPKAGEKVKVHGGEAFASGGKDEKGRLVLKPIKRRENKINLRNATIVVASTLALFLVTWILGTISPKNTILAYVGLILVTPPLVYAPYFFLKDAEAIENLEGRELINRVALCSAFYLFLWGGFSLVAWYTTAAFGGELYIWALAAAPFLFVGALLGSNCFNLEFEDGAIHFAFYLFFTVALRYLLGFAFEAGTWVSNAAASGIPLDPRM
ncbi:MAG: hypothetical protein Q4D38_01185 [Planctomycetia bacterium]|nr:hypothetical protein [Planctomycetia bacterium]